MSPRILPAGDAAALAAAAAVIRRGGLVGVPTETVYGLACALEEGALARLLAAKARPAEKGITLLVDSLDQVRSVALLPEAARRLAEAFWPGPLTLVLPARPGVHLPGLVSGDSGLVGVRIPDLEATRVLARTLGPLPLTSANRSGAADAVTAAEVVAALGDAVEIVLDGGPSPGGVPSTVVAVSEGGPWSILRQGALSAAEIERAVHA
jgi:L-threonylcarbamoyladenylate synthase